MNIIKYSNNSIENNLNKIDLNKIKKIDIPNGICPIIINGFIIMNGFYNRSKISITSSDLEYYYNDTLIEFKNKIEAMNFLKAYLDFFIKLGNSFKINNNICLLLYLQRSMIYNCDTDIFEYEKNCFIVKIRYWIERDEINFISDIFENVNIDFNLEDIVYLKIKKTN